MTSGLNDFFLLSLQVIHDDDLDELDNDFDDPPSDSERGGNKKGLSLSIIRLHLGIKGSRMV